MNKIFKINLYHYITSKSSKRKPHSVLAICNILAIDSLPKIRNYTNIYLNSEYLHYYTTPIKARNINAWLCEILCCVIFKMRNLYVLALD